MKYTEEQIDKKLEEKMVKKAEAFAKLRRRSLKDKWPEDAVYHEAFSGYVVGYCEAISDFRRLIEKECTNCGHLFSGEGEYCELCNSEE